MGAPARWGGEMPPAQTQLLWSSCGLDLCSWWWWGGGAMAAAASCATAGQCTWLVTPIVGGSLVARSPVAGRRTAQHQAPPAQAPPKLWAAGHIFFESLSKTHLCVAALCQLSASSHCLQLVGAGATWVRANACAKVRGIGKGQSRARPMLGFCFGVVAGVARAGTHAIPADVACL